MACRLARQNVAKRLINALTGQVGTRTHMSGYPTYQDLTPWFGEENIYSP